MRRRDFLKKSLLTCSAGVVATGAYTWLWEPHWVEFSEIELPVQKLPPSLAGKRMVQLTDLHIGPRVSDEFLVETFEAVDRLAPEIVVYTGDFTSYEADILSHAANMFTHLPKGRRGTFGVLGNHDYGLGWSDTDVADRLTELAGEAGVKILRNEVAEVEGLQIVGLDDLWAEAFDATRAFGGIETARAAIVLSHNPDTADLPVWGDFRGWILAGHTHGGQCKPPFLPPPLLPVKNRRYTAGIFNLPAGRNMYISRGLGHLLPVRFNVRPEVTVFTLLPA